MADDTAIRVEHVSKDFVLPHERVSSVKGLFTSALRRRRGNSEAQHALRDISFDIREGEFFGIVGRNGSGKSTMLKILAGIYQPTRGKVSTKGKLVPFIELGVGFNPELTGRENVFLNGAMLGFSESEIAAMYDEIVSFAELERFMDQKLKNYSSGMQVRLAFSMATRSEADILLIDEVLAVGDADFQRKCFEYFKLLKKNKKTVVFVSHDMSAVREFCDEAALIDENQLIFRGSAEAVADEYTKLFLKPADETKPGTKVTTSKDGRYGTGAATIHSPKLDKPQYDDNNNMIRLSYTINVNQSLDNLVAGFSVHGLEGKTICGTNTQFKKQVIHGIKKGSKLKLSWEIQNIFSDGEYLVTLATHNSDGVTIYDWWPEATILTVKRRERSIFDVSPQVDVTLTR